MTENPLAQAACLLEQAFALIDSSPDHLAALLLAEGGSRRLDRVKVAQIAAAEHDNSLVQRGYKGTVDGLKDLLGWDHETTRRHVTVAHHVGPRTAPDGTPQEPVLPVTAAAFAANATTLRHVETISILMDSKQAARVSAEDRIAIEAVLGEAATSLAPHKLRAKGQKLLAAADQGEPDDRPGRNTMSLKRNPDGTGSIRAEFGDPEAFATVATALDARTRPSEANRGTTSGERNAEALVGICRFALGHENTGDVGGERPRVVVTIGLEDLENRCRGALLDTGGELTPSQLRRIACDAEIIPAMLGKRGEPLDVGRSRRTVPLHLRRLVAARDGGCVHPGCDRPPSWCEVHHVIEWQHGGTTCLDNLVMLCCRHHDHIHSTEWTIDMSTGIPRFIPPPWLETLWAQS